MAAGACGSRIHCICCQEQKKMNAGAQFTFSFICSLGPHLTLPTARVRLLSLMNLIQNFIVTPRGMPHSDAFKLTINISHDGSYYDHLCCRAHYIEYFKCSQIFTIYLFFEKTCMQCILTILTPTYYSSQTHLLQTSLLPNFVSSLSTHVRSPDLYGPLSIHTSCTQTTIIT